MSTWTRAVVLTGLLVSLAALPLAAQEAGETDGKCMLWKVSSGEATVYLLGTLHFSSPKIYPINETIEDAFAESDFLVMEISMSPENQMKTALLTQKKGMYQPPESLEADLSEEALTKLKAHLKDRGMTPAQVNTMRPWLLNAMLVLPEVMRLGYRPELGLDMYFFQHARARRKPILELETVEGQLSLLADSSKEEQELVLLDTLEHFGEVKEQLQKLTDTWLAGDADGLDQALRESVPSNPRLKAYFKRLFDDRNLKMTARVEEYLRTEATYFVVVGAGHLVGEKGIVELLRAKKHAVEQLDKTPRGPADQQPRPAQRVAVPAAE